MPITPNLKHSKVDPAAELFSTNYQKALRFLALHAGEYFVEGEVRDETGISRAGTNNALRALTIDALIEVEKRGRLSLYRANPDDSVIRQIKVLLNVLEIDRFVNKLRPLSEKIVLYGSAAAGTDTVDSDIDLFVLSNLPHEIQEKASRKPTERQIHLIVRTHLEFISARKKEQFFFEEVSRGIVLYERLA